MEPISLIITALSSAAAVAAVQGAAHGITQGVAQGSVQEAFKALIKRKLADVQNGEMILEEYEQDPKNYEEPLKNKLAEAGADKDGEIIKKAQELLKQLKPEESATGKFNLKVDGNFQGFAGENKGTVNQTFNGK